MNAIRAAGLVGFVAVAAYANSIGNGFAYDDNEIVARNPLVQSGAPSAALNQPYWPRFSPGSGLYRPVTIASFALEWSVWEGDARFYHASNVVLHVGVSLAVFGLLLGLTGPASAAVGAGLFALHPVHTEAVANVVGRSELLAALFVLIACLLYDRVRSPAQIPRTLRLLGIGSCYVMALGSKEIAVTLPALLVLLELFRRSKRELRLRVWDELPVFLILGAGLAAYLVARLTVLGSVIGELPAPELRTLALGERLLTALALWPEYLRLMVWPFDLSADYSPAVLTVTKGLSPDLVAGGLAVVGLAGAAWLSWFRSPLIALGILWFGVAVSPVSQILFPTGVLLAERTLYLPSVGVALVAAGLAAQFARVRRPRTRWVAYATAFAFGAALFAKTVHRNPSWMSTYTVLTTLASEHPESSLALRSRGTGLVRAGEIASGIQAYEGAVQLAPSNYAILTEVANFYGEQKIWDRGSGLLLQAIEAAPNRPAAYRLLASQLILQQRYREAHRLALRGLSAAGPDRALWALVSETYVAKGDYPAAVRAREAALGQAPDSAEDWARLADILELQGDSASAARARAQASSGDSKNTA